MILRSLQISQQFETQHNSSSIVINCQDGRLSCFVVEVTSTRFELKDGFSSIDIRICPESLAEQGRTTMLPLTFQSSILEVTIGNKTSFLQRSSTFPSWLLELFSLVQMDLLENIFQPNGH